MRLYGREIKNLQTPLPSFSMSQASNKKLRVQRHGGGRLFQSLGSLSKQKYLLGWIFPIGSSHLLVLQKNIIWGFM